MKYRIVVLTAILFTACNLLHAQVQTGKLSGVIIDANNEETLVGANIYVESLKKGTSTDKNGEFSIEVPAGHYRIVISYMGYRTRQEEVRISELKTKKLVILLEPETQSLGEVVVTAKSEARQLREQAMPMSVISMQQLQGTVSNVQDVLSKTVGVTIRNTGGVGSSSRVSVRGLEGKRIGFFIDGSPMNDNSDFIDINGIPVDMIDRIEIYKGVVPARFGGSSVGGAVNIVIREYPPKYLDASYSIESFNTHKLSLVTKRNIATKGLEFGGGGFYTYSDNNYKMESPFEEGLIIKRNHDKFKKLAVAGSLKARKWWFDLVEFEPVFIHTFKEIQGIEYNIEKAHTYSDAFIFANKLEKENFLTEGLDMESNLAYAYTVFHMVDTAAYRYNWDGTTYPAVSEYGGEIGKWASNARNEKHTITHKLHLNYVINNNHSINLNSLFSFASGHPKDDLKNKVVGYKTNFRSTMASWIAGLGYDFRTDNDIFLNSFNVKYYMYGMNTHMSSIMSSEAEKVDMLKRDFGISNALRYRFTPDFMGKLSVGYDVRLPAESELLGDGYTVAPSGNLLPERNTSVNLGFLLDRTGKDASNLQVEVNTFYGYLENMIRFTGGYLQSQYQNFGKMRTLGVEVEVKADLTHWLYGYCNMTYQDLRDVRKFEPNTHITNPTKGSRMPNIPYLLANAGLEYHKENLFGGKGQNTRIFTDGSFVEEYFYDFEQSRFQERRIPRTFSANIGIEHSFMNGRFIISARMNNLTDARMMSEFNRPLPGRNWGVRLRYVLK